MKKTFLIFATLLQTLFAISQTDTATVKGQVHSGDIKSVKIEWLQDNHVYDIQKTYEGNIDSQGKFEIKVPLSRIARGRITAGKYSHYISLLPKDNFFADIDGDNIRYVGKGGEKNNFLYYIENKGYSETDYYKDHNEGKLPLKEFADKMANFRDKRGELLTEYISKSKLSSKKIKVEKEPVYFNEIETGFVNYFLADNQAKYLSLLMMYPDMYEYRNNIARNTSELPEEYNHYHSFKNLINDDLIISNTYINTVSNFCVTKWAEMSKSNDSKIKKIKDIKYSILFDSLKGKTQEYVLAYKLSSDFAADRIDTTVFKKFTKIAKDPITINTVKKSYNNYTRKNLLIGKPLVKEFVETVLEDTLGNKITFGKMMEKYKGKVVYLDIWGMYCGPCLALMPAAKKLKDELEGKPIEFVYIANDIKFKNYWSSVVKATQTDKNHYLLKDGLNSKLMQYMEMNWVPCYMIFDKQGRMVSYSAPQPNDGVARNTLLKLAADNTSPN